MALTFEIETAIEAPPQRVWDLLVDAEKMKLWMPGLVSMERLTPGEMGVGTQLRETRKMMGHTASEVFEVTEFDPPRALGLYVDGAKGSSKKGWYRFRHTLTPQGKGTLVRLSGECGGLTGCMGFLGKLMLGPMRKMIAKDLAALRAAAERAD